MPKHSNRIQYELLNTHNHNNELAKQSRLIVSYILYCTALSSTTVAYVLPLNRFDIQHQSRYTCTIFSIPMPWIPTYQLETVQCIHVNLSMIEFVSITYSESHDFVQLTLKKSKAPLWSGQIRSQMGYVIFSKCCECMVYAERVTTMHAYT